MTDKETAANIPSQADASSSADEFESLNADERAAFDKIMAEIATGGDASDKRAEPETGTAPPEPAIDPARSERNQASENRSAEGDGPPGTDFSPEGKSSADEEPAPEPAEGDLSDDQQAALDKIMAETEAHKAAEKDTARTEAAPAAPPPGKRPDPEVNEEQQAALDKIMAEIQSRKSVDKTAAKTADSEAPEDISPEDISEDQQAALDRIMAEIQGKKAGGKPTAADSAEPSESGPTAAGSTGQADLDMIMAEIEGDGGEADPPGAAAHENLTLDQFNDELSHLLCSAKNGSAPDTAPPDGEPAPAEAPAEPEAAGDSDGQASPLPFDRPRSAAQNTQAAEPKPARRSAGQSRLGLILASIVVVAALCGAAYHFRDRLRSTEIQADPAPQSKSLESAALKPNAEDQLRTAPGAPPPQTSKNDPLELLVRELQSARGFIEAKINEIEELKAYYRRGIMDEQLLIGAELKRSGLTTLEQALQHTKIDLNLRTIQRQMVYSAKLETPLLDLRQASEELLYLERRTRFFKTLANAASGLPIRDFENEVAAMVEHHLQAAGQLSIDAVEVAVPSLETIWRDVQNGLKRGLDGGTALPTDPHNEAIAQEICRGLFERKYQLTALSAETAQCLLQWSGKDLYLNEVGHLSPEAAAVLAKWPGEWLSLNGLRELSPETARELARWSGRRLSLNGLNILPPEATNALSRWQGEQIEMVGLRAIGSWENYATRLYLSEELRRRLEVQ